jgi:hypothetical protein
VKSHDPEPPVANRSPIAERCLPVAVALLAVTVLACHPWRSDDSVHYERPHHWEWSESWNRDDATVAVQSDRDAVTTAVRADFDPASAELSGTWAQLQVTATVSEAPLVGAVRSQSQAILRIEQRQTANELTMHVVVCDLDVNTEGAIQTTIPDAFVAGLPQSERRASLEIVGGQLHVTQGRIHQVIGARLEDVAHCQRPVIRRSSAATVTVGMSIALQGLFDGGSTSSSMWNRLMATPGTKIMWMG